MIGVFDSGVGGICAFRELRRLMPREDIVYLADRKNAPYGTKSEEQIIALVKADIKRLRTVGAEKILIACCTASCIYDSLSYDEKQISLPIINPAAEKAVKCGERIMVIATERTVLSGVFTREVKKYGNAQVSEFAEQRLVALVEGGCRDGRINSECDEILNRIARTAKEISADTLILGCTHFSHLEGELKKRCRLKTVSPAREGALSLLKTINQGRKENGRTIYM